MTAQEFLKQAYIAHGEIEIKLEEINRLQALSTRITTTLKCTPSGGNVPMSRIENTIIRMDGQIKQLAAEVENLLTITATVRAAIKKVQDATERKILEYRYLCFFSWKQISLLTKTTQRNIFYVHDKALKNFLVPL